MNPVEQVLAEQTRVLTEMQELAREMVAVQAVHGVLLAVLLRAAPAEVRASAAAALRGLADERSGAPSGAAIANATSGWLVALKG